MEGIVGPTGRHDDRAGITTRGAKATAPSSSTEVMVPPTSTAKI